MKLPEYDNRPQPGEPLYKPVDNSSWEDLKFTLLGWSVPAMFAALVGAILYAVFR